MKSRERKEIAKETDVDPPKALIINCGSTIKTAEGYKVPGLLLHLSVSFLDSSNGPAETQFSVFHFLTVHLSLENASFGSRSHRLMTRGS